VMRVAAAMPMALWVLRAAVIDLAAAPLAAALTMQSQQELQATARLLKEDVHEIAALLNSERDQGLQNAGAQPQLHVSRLPGGLETLWRSAQSFDQVEQLRVKVPAKPAAAPANGLPGGAGSASVKSGIGAFALCTLVVLAGFAWLGERRQQKGLKGAADQPASEVWTLRRPQGSR